MANENMLQNEAIKDFDFEAMEDLISQQLEDQIADLEVIKEQRDKIGTPESLVNAVIDAAVEGFNNNIAIIVITTHTVVYFYINTCIRHI